MNHSFTVAHRLFEIVILKTSAANEKIGLIFLMIKCSGLHDFASGQ